MEQRLGRYRILEEIASGSQGAVYRAFDPDSGQIVAVKVLHPSLTGNHDYLERFRREASLASSIDHPNVVKIFEVGADGDRHFITLEFLPESLSRVIEGAGALPVERAAAFGIQIAQGLAAAHALGIVHRDVKPQNVLIGPDGVAKLTDFGIARGELLPTMTATGSTMGTPHYMSPEQARGERADERSDLYSLGCVLYQMLAGEVPFKGNTPLAVVRQHIEERPRPVRRLRSEVPAAVERIVSRSMEKGPDRRYQTARELVEALTEAVPGAAPVDREPSRQTPRPPPSAPPERPAAVPVRPSRLPGFFRWPVGVILVLWGLFLLFVGLTKVSDGQHVVQTILFLASGAVTLGAGAIAMRRKAIALGPLGRGRLAGLLTVAGLALLMAGVGQSGDGGSETSLPTSGETQAGAIGGEAATPTVTAIVALPPSATPIAVSARAPTTTPFPVPTATSVPVMTTATPTATRLPASTVATVSTATPTAVLQLTQTEWQIYINDEYGYSIDVPPGWTVNQDDDGVVRIVEPSGRGPWLSVYSQTLSASYTLDSWADFVIDFRESYNEVLFEVLSRSRVTLPSGLEAVRFVYRNQVGPGSCLTHPTEIVVLVGSQAYGLSTNVCEANLGRYEDQLEFMQNSFALTSSALTRTPRLIATSIPKPTATPTPTSTAAPTPAPSPTAASVPTATPTSSATAGPVSDERFGVIGHSTLKADSQYFLDQLGVKWYLTFDEVTSIGV